jgi:hypothetical protein
MYAEFSTVHNECQTKSKLLNDTANHTKGWRTMMDRSLSTSRHEVGHLLSADIRNNVLKNPVKSPKNGFYLGNNKFYICTEPKIRKSHVAPYVHSQLRGFRFKTYITGQTAWDDTALYVFDEWNQYCLGTECAIELNSLGDTSNKGTDISSGPVEFLVYSMSLVLAVKDKDPDYFNREPDFLPFCSYQAARALKLSREANMIYPWDATTNYLKAWDSDMCKEYRAMLTLPGPNPNPPNPNPKKPLNPEDFAQG